MLNIILDLDTGLAKLASATTIKCGASVPITISTVRGGANASPGGSPVFELGLATDAAPPVLKAYCNTFAAENDHTFTGTLDANDTRLVTFMAGKGATNFNCEVAWTVGGTTQAAPNFALPVQPRGIPSDPTTEGGPDFYTEPQVDALLAAVATSIAAKIPKVGSATDGHLALLNADGTLRDGGAVPGVAPLEARGNIYGWTTAAADNPAYTASTYIACDTNADNTGSITINVTLDGISSGDKLVTCGSSGDIPLGLSGGEDRATVTNALFAALSAQYPTLAVTEDTSSGDVGLTTPGTGTTQSIVPSVGTGAFARSNGSSTGGAAYTSPPTGQVQTVVLRGRPANGAKCFLPRWRPVIGQAYNCDLWNPAATIVIGYSADGATMNWPILTLSPRADVGGPIVIAERSPVWDSTHAGIGDAVPNWDLIATFVPATTIAADFQGGALQLFDLGDEVPSSD